MGYLETRANLEGKVAAIIGGGGGLGRASAVDLGRAGVALSRAHRPSRRSRPSGREGSQMVTTVSQFMLPRTSARPRSTARVRACPPPRQAAF